MTVGCRAHSVPRTRGDGPETPGAWQAPAQCSPHTRGWTEYTARGCRGKGVFPAHAGMDRVSWAAVDTFMLCSPHTRGWTGNWRQADVASTLLQ